jgi:hypothetical protein
MLTNDNRRIVFPRKDMNNVNCLLIELLFHTLWGGTFLMLKKEIQETIFGEMIK